MQERHKQYLPGSTMLKELTMQHQVMTIVGLFLVLSLLLFGISYFKSDTMDSVRGYVRGEGLWAKAQKDAFFHLHNYAREGREEDYDAFVKALSVPLGDHQARINLQKDELDMKVVTEGLIAGQNHVRDIPGMVRFFRRFEHFPYLSEAIAIWTEADGEIERLQAIGVAIHQARQSNNLGSLPALLDQLYVINEKLDQLEYDFSFILSEGARWVKQVLLMVSIVLFIIMLVPVLMVTRKIVASVDRTERELRISENRFNSLYNTDMLGIVDWYKDGRLTDANDAFLQMLGYKAKDIAEGKLNWRDMTPREFWALDEKALGEIAEKGFCMPFEKEFISYDGRRVPVYLGASMLDGSGGKGICFILDHTQQKKARSELQLSATVFDASSDGILITDKNFQVSAVNQGFCDITGYSKSDVIENGPTIVTSDNLPASFYERLWETLKEEHTWQGDVVGRKKQGSIVYVRMSITAVRDETHHVSHYVWVFTDITERKLAEEQLRQLAHFDGLTGLANRSLFNDLLSNAILRGRRNRGKFALLFIDLDKFKPVNDRFGHDVGDKLLKEIARRLEDSVRENDTVARLGGDEFVVLLESVSGPEGAAVVAKKIIEQINLPCFIDDLKLDVGCSIGISMYPQDGESQLDLLNSSDIAMYAAKAGGRNAFYFFNPENNEFR